MSQLQSSRRSSHWSRARSRRRAAAQLAVLGLIATTIVLLPTPGWTLEASARTDTSTPVLVPVASADAPALAPLDQLVDEGTTAAPESVVPATADPAAAASADSRLIGGEEDIDDFVLIGVGYRSASGEAAQLRVRTDGEWSEWTRIVMADDHAPDVGSAEATRAAATASAADGATVSDPLWIDHADAYQLDLPADATDTTTYVVRETEEEVRLTDGTERADAATGQPSIRNRAAWGARAYRGTPDVSPPLRRAIVHHTVNSNSYSAAQVPAMLRSIQAFHQDAQGWDDIGYNFVIDRFGGIWEGRAGGIRNPVIGAHAENHNTGSVGVSFLGDATSSVTSGAVNAYGQLIGWKMFISGLRPGSGNIMGHRDVGQTSCPGSALYNNLGRIRSLSLSKYNSLIGPGSFTSKTVAVSGTYQPLSGDFNGDAYSDVLWYGAGEDQDFLWRGSANGFTGSNVTVGGTYRPVVGDFNGDGRSDVFWYGPGADADRVWFGQTGGDFTSKSFTIGNDYQPVAGDFDGDGEDDIFWYGSGTAKDYLWFGTSAEAFSGRAVQVDGVYSPFAGDFDGDLRDDVFWYGAGGAVDKIWFGAGGRAFSHKAVTIGGTYVPLVADVTGGGTDDIVWYGPGPARDSLHLGNTDRTFTGRTLNVTGVYDTPFTGDWNADGRGDVFWYRAAGNDLLWLGAG